MLIKRGENAYFKPGLHNYGVPRNARVSQPAVSPISMNMWKYKQLVTRSSLSLAQRLLHHEHTLDLRVTGQEDVAVLPIATSPAFCSAAWCPGWQPRSQVKNLKYWYTPTFAVRVSRQSQKAFNWIQCVVFSPAVVLQMASSEVQLSSFTSTVTSHINILPCIL